jgi:hypothetical protein
MLAPTETLYTNGTGTVLVHYLPFDFGSGIDTCFIWIRYDNEWHPDGTGSALLNQGTDFQFAARCRDRAGNLGAWSIGAPFAA